MARKPRINKPGFYHLINRGVERRKVYIEDDDYVRFLEILNEASELYGFSVYSFCLMSNHYHLLIETNSDNLSLIMKQVNSKYGMYFNGKYKRVGHLWQGRFKSQYVYDHQYLDTLIKYIEYNPVKAKITRKIGEYLWAMSSSNFECLILNVKLLNSELFDFELLRQVNFDLGFSDDDEKVICEFEETRFEIKEDDVVIKNKKSFDWCFDSVDREMGIVQALRSGYTQVEVGNYLGLSNIAISKIYKTYRGKEVLFNKLKDLGVFWSYSKELNYQQCGNELFIEYLLKYGDFDDIVQGFKLFGKRIIKSVWQSTVISNNQFVRLNVMLANVFFDMDVDGSYFKNIENERYKKLRMLAS